MIIKEILLLLETAKNAAEKELTQEQKRCS